MRKILTVAAALAALVVAAPAGALEPRGTTTSSASASSGVGSPTMNNTLSPWGLLGYGYGAGAGFGIGARYQIEIVPQGFLPRRFKDELGLEFGMDWLYYSWSFYGYTWTFNEFAPVVGVVWNVWFTNRFAVYPKIDTGFRFGTWSGGGAGLGNPSGYGGFLVEGAAGVIYNTGPVMLRAEVGSYALRLGVAFKF